MKAHINIFYRDFPYRKNARTIHVKRRALNLIDIIFFSAGTWKKENQKHILQIFK
jgi:hypothetical protein